MIRSRIAPTPSGYLHIGNIFNFLTTYIRTKKFGGHLHLRIDDIDAARVKDDYLEDIFDSLRWLGITCDSGPTSVLDFKKNYSQQNKVEYYRSFLDRFDVLSYPCSCSRKNINQCNCKEKDLQFTPDQTAIRITTESHRELNEAMPNFVIWRKDNLPAYQLTSLVDDIDEKINLIIRGDDLFDSTTAQVFLSEIAGFKDYSKITFLHHDLVSLDDGTKLSKSSGDTSLSQMRENGFTQKDIINLYCSFMDIEAVNTLEELLGAI